MDSMVRKCLVVGYDVSGKDVATDASTDRLDTAKGTLEKDKTPLQKNLLNLCSLLRMLIMLTLHLIFSISYYFSKMYCIQFN